MGTVITVAMRFVLPTDDDGASKNPTIRQKKNIIKKIPGSPTSKKKYYKGAWNASSGLWHSTSINQR